MARQQAKIQIDFSYFGVQQHSIQYVAATPKQLNRTVVTDDE